MAKLNLADRFVYSGSLTTPPCLEDLYWNVLATVYPIKKYHLDYYKNVVAKRGKASDATTDVIAKGNHRLVRPATALHKVQLLKAKPMVEPDGTTVTTAAQNASLALTIIFMIFMILSMALLVYVCVLWDEVKKAENPAPESNIEIGPGGDKAENPSTAKALVP